MPSNTPAKSQSPTSDNQIQGEGDYKSNRTYVKSAEAFAQSGKVEEAARKAKPETQEVAEELRRAEKEGASHAKGDPAKSTTAPSVNRR